MTLHIVLDDAANATPAARSLLSLAAHSLERGGSCRIYATASTKEYGFAKPVSELAFESDPGDILVWHIAHESPDIHLAERFPGVRALLCEGSVLADAGGDQLLSLTRSFEAVYGADEATRAALEQTGFPLAQRWPLPAEEDAVSLGQFLTGLAQCARLPRGADSATVSVVICTLNRAAHLESCLLQLRRQRYPRFEVIVVNGPSTDDTEAVLARFAGEIKVRRNARANLCVSRNLGIAAAAGEIVAFLDDDSFAHPDWMREALAAFDDPLTAAVGGFSYRFRDETVEFANGLLTETAYPWPIQPKPGNHYRGTAGFWNTVTGNNCLFRRDALLAVGGFDEQIPYTHDESNVVMKMARRGMRARHRPLAIVHHGGQPSLNRRDEFDLNWKVMVRDSIYCGYRNRPKGSNAARFLLRTLAEHAHHRLRDPIDWWLYGKVTLRGFLRIERQCAHGLLAGVAKAVFARPRPITKELLGEAREPFLPFPNGRRPTKGCIALLAECAPLAETLSRECRQPNVLAEGHANLLDSRRGVFYHSVHCPTREARLIGFWRKLQELAVRSGVRLLLGESSGDAAILVAADPRFQAVRLEASAITEADAITERIAREAAKFEARTPLIECITPERMAPSSGATRWRDPVYEYDFWSLPADGSQSVQAAFTRPCDAGRCRLDIFVGLAQPPLETDRVCEIVLRTANGSTLHREEFGGSHFGGTRWAILSASFNSSGSDGPLLMTIANTGFTGLLVQRVELREWRDTPTAR